MWKIAVELARPKNVLLASATVPLGAHLALTGRWSIDHTAIVAMQTASVIFFIAAGNTFNDISDKSIDKLAKPHKPIPSGRISVDTATKLAYCFTLFSFIFMALVAYQISDPIPSIAIWAIASLLMYTYDMGPQTKNAGILGNTAISLMVGAVIIYGAASVSLSTDSLVLYVACVAFFANLAREIIKDCEDMETDEGRNTLPMRIGLEWARAVAYIFILLALIFLYIPHWKGPLEFNDLLYQSPAIVALASLNGPLYRGEDHKAQSQIRIGMLLGLLSFAFLVMKDKLL
ncbi:MAG: geranylgeranylglycerol-phosphate geranylgeranyltransferase [Candidatus Poseidoniaceae archaeon]|jgi:geranylgeranylglycerol-phosphate geranylgeranyltransferase|nr:geranylgeranylglycerol-phosphate geranylgeranyltransferase [Candidatus Poseidoniaceae archaeon]